MTAHAQSPCRHRSCGTPAAARPTCRFRPRGTAAGTVLQRRRSSPPDAAGWCSKSLHRVPERSGRGSARAIRQSLPRRRVAAAMRLRQIDVPRDARGASARPPGADRCPRRTASSARRPWRPARSTRSAELICTLQIRMPRGIEPVERVSGLLELHGHVAGVETQPDVPTTSSTVSCGEVVAGRLPHERRIEQILMKEPDRVLDGLDVARRLGLDRQCDRDAGPLAERHEFRRVAEHAGGHRRLVGLVGDVPIGTRQGPC